MDLARQERDKYAQWKQESTQPKPAAQTKKPAYNSRKGGRDEQVPDWFYKRNEEPVQEKPQDDAVDFEKERLKILQKLDKAGE